MRRKERVDTRDCFFFDNSSLTSDYPWLLISLLKKSEKFVNLNVQLSDKTLWESSFNRDLIKNKKYFKKKREKKFFVELERDDIEIKEKRTHLKTKKNLVRSKKRKKKNV